MADDTNSLSIVLRAIDAVSGPLAKIQSRFSAFGKAAGAFASPVTNAFGTFAAQGPLVSKSLDGIGGGLSGLFGKVSKAALYFGGLGVAGAYGLARVGHAAIEAGDDLGEIASRIGVTATQFASLEYAAEQADIKQEKFRGGIDAFAVSLGKANGGTGRLYAFLKKTDPVFARTLKGTHGVQAGVAAMAKEFQSIADPAKRAALAAAAFGDPQFGEFLKQGTKAIEEQRKEYVSLAGDQDEFAKRSGEVDNAMRRASVSFLGARNSLVSAFLPALEKVSAAAVAFIGKNKDNLAAWANKSAEAFEKWSNGGGIDRTIGQIEALSSTLGDVIDDLNSWKGAVLGAGLVLWQIKEPLALVTSGLWGLSKAAYAAALVPLASNIGNFFVALRAGYPAMEAASLAFGAFAAPVLATAAAFLSVGAALYQVYKHWSVLKESGFADGLAATKALLGFGETDAEAFKRTTGGTGRSAFVGLPPESLRASGAGEPPAPSVAGKTEAKVIVDFNNAPKGTRVSVDPKSTAEVDHSMGYSMAETM